MVIQTNGTFNKRISLYAESELEDFFHYRNLDVSTIKELVTRWYPKLKYKKNPQHIALQDIKDSIEELEYYRGTIFKNSSIFLDTI